MLDARLIELCPALDNLSRETGHKVRAPTKLCLRCSLPDTPFFGVTLAPSKSLDHDCSGVVLDRHRDAHSVDEHWKSKSSIDGNGVQWTAPLFASNLTCPLHQWLKCAPSPSSHHHHNPSLIFVDVLITCIDHLLPCACWPFVIIAAQQISSNSTLFALPFIADPLLGL